MNIYNDNINNLKYVSNTTLMAENEDDLRKVLRKLNTMKTKIMLTRPVKSWLMGKK